MRLFLEWLLVTLGLGTVAALIRYMAVWYIFRRMRRLFRRRRHGEAEEVARR